MGRPKIEDFKVRNVEVTFLIDRTASARKIWKDAKFRFGAGSTPSERKTQDIVRVLRGRDDIHPVGPDPLIEPWSERWRDPAELETLMVLHYTAQSVDPFVDPIDKPQPDCKGLTDRQATWACRLRNLFNLSSRRDTLMLLWFSLKYSDMERTTLSLGYESDDIYTGELDRWLMEWTGRLPAKYPEDFIPDEAYIAEQLFYYFRDVSEGRQPMWVMERKDDGYRATQEKKDLRATETAHYEAREASSTMVDLWKQLDMEFVLLDRQSFIAEGYKKAEGQDWEDSKDKIFYDTKEQVIQEMVNRLYSTLEGKAAYEGFLRETSPTSRLQISDLQF